MRHWNTWIPASVAGFRGDLKHVLIYWSVERVEMFSHKAGRLWASWKRELIPGWSGTHQAGWIEVVYRWNASWSHWLGYLGLSPFVFFPVLELTGGKTFLWS